MIFDEYISAATEVDELKMESVRQYLAQATAKVASAEIPDSVKVVAALNYCAHYIERCQATFVNNQQRITKLEADLAQAQIQINQYEGRVQAYEKTLNDLKQWIK